MAECKLCARKGFFLSVSERGICKSCEPSFLRDVQRHIQIITDCVKLVDESKNAKTKLSRCDLLIKHAKALLEYEQRRISTISVPPSEILKEYSALREQIMDEIERGAKCPYCNARLEKIPRTKKKCIYCGNVIRVRAGELYTEAEFEKVEEKERLKLIKELKASQRQTLMDYKKSGVVQYVEILAAMDERTCENCKKWNGEKISLDQAIKESILPIKDCSSDWCRCTYAPVA